MGRRVEVQVSDQARWVRLPHGRALPTRFWARIDDSAIPYVVRIEVVVTAGSPGVRQLVVHQREDEYPPGPPVSSLRSVRVSDCLRLAVDAAARRRTNVRSDRYPGAFTVEGLDDQAWGGPSAEQHRDGGDRLDVVARAYRAARAEGRPVRQAVMEALGVQTSQAARLIRAAREAGKIPPRDGGLPPRDIDALRRASGEVYFAPPPPSQPKEDDD